MAAEVTRRGRPPFKVTPEIIEQVEGLAAQGLIDKEIASVIGCHLSTLALKKKQFSDFSDAIKRGKHKGIDEVTNALFTKAKSGDNVAMLFYLKCRAGWKEAADTDDGNSRPSVTVVIQKDAV